MAEVVRSCDRNQARELDIPPQTLTRWVWMYGNEGSDAFVGSGNLGSEKQEERDLQKQIRDLEEENRILKRLFASLPTTRSDFWFHPGTPTRIPCIKDV